MDKFKKIKIGDKAYIYHQITQDDIKKFVDLTGDDNKLHADNDFAKNTEFRKPVAHGMLGASFISTLKGIRLNMISPGMTETNLVSWIPERASYIS